MGNQTSFSNTKPSYLFYPIWRDYLFSSQTDQANDQASLCDWSQGQVISILAEIWVISRKW